MNTFWENTQSQIQTNIESAHGLIWEKFTGEKLEYAILENCYSVAPFDFQDIWIDLGARIGEFCIRYSSRVGHIFAYEPYEPHIELLNRNIVHNHIQNITVCPYAAVATEHKTIALHYDKTHTGEASLYMKGTAVEVKCENIRDIIQKCKPNKIKMDIEGGEYELLPYMSAYNLFDNIQYMILEYHFYTLNDRTGMKYLRVMDILKKHFKVEVTSDKPNMNANNRRVCIISCAK